MLNFDFTDLPPAVTLDDPAYLAGHKEEKDRIAWEKKRRFLSVLVWANRKAREKGWKMDVERFIEAYRLMGGELVVNRMVS